MSSNCGKSSGEQLHADAAKLVDGLEQTRSHHLIQPAQRQALGNGDPQPLECCRLKRCRLPAGHRGIGVGAVRHATRQWTD